MKTSSSWLLILIVAAASGLGFNLFMPQGVGFLPKEVADPSWEAATIRVALTLYDQKVLFIDARDPGKYKSAHIRGAVNLNPRELETLYPLLEEQINQAGQVVVYGRSTSRFPAAEIGNFLRKQGLERVWVMESSLDQWEQAGGKVRKRKNRGGR